MGINVESNPIDLDQVVSPDQSEASSIESLPPPMDYSVVELSELGDEIILIAKKLQDGEINQSGAHMLVLDIVETLRRAGRGDRQTTS